MAEIRELNSNIQRIYEIKDSIIWELARDPGLGSPLRSNQDYRVYETSPLDEDAPKFWVLYRPDFQNEKVFLYSIKLIKEE
ncbi:MAG: hypothetical protein ACTSR2_11945 [Candidatus Hodarchaeales archaeon]